MIFGDKNPNIITFEKLHMADNHIETRKNTQKKIFMKLSVLFLIWHIKHF